MGVPICVAAAPFIVGLFDSREDSFITLPPQLTSDTAVCLTFVFEFQSLLQATLYSHIFFSRCSHKSPYENCEPCMKDDNDPYFTEMVGHTYPYRYRGLFLKLISKYLTAAFENSLRCTFDEKRQILVMRNPDMMSASVHVFCTAMEAQTLSTASMDFFTNFFHVPGDYQPRVLIFQTKDARDQMADSKLLCDDD